MDDMREKLIKLIQDAVNGCARNWAAIIADHIIANGVVPPPCKVGNTVHFLLEDEMVDGGMFVTSAHTITEVGSKGVWISRHTPAKDDMSDFISWKEFGKTAFLTREEAEKALEERKE